MRKDANYDDHPIAEYEWENILDNESDFCGGIFEVDAQQEADVLEDLTE